MKKHRHAAPEVEECASCRGHKAMHQKQALERAVLIALAKEPEYKAAEREFTRAQVAYRKQEVRSYHETRRALKPHSKRLHKAHGALEALKIRLRERLRGELV